MSEALSGFNAMGHPIPPERLANAHRHLKMMVPDIGTEEAHGLIGKVADRLERDLPFDAQKEGRKVLDITGTYRLMAILLTEAPA